MPSWFLHRWRVEGGYRELLKIALPLILSTASWSVQFIVDRMFLFWYSSEAVSASMQGSIMSFTILAFFLATASYCNTFVAQFIGAKKPGMVGRVVWQAIFFSIGSGILMLFLLPAGVPLFRLLGHSPQLQALEVTYFKIILAGSMAMFLGDALSSFFSGRGETWTIMWVNFAAVALNIFLNWIWIFGYLGFPEMGVAGAAAATVVAYCVKAALLFAIMVRKKYRSRFGILSGCRFDRDLFLRLLRFGLPSGLTFFLDISVWAFFTAIIGRIGLCELAATSVAFQINSIAFMPMIGIGIAVSTLVGQRLGDNSPHLAARSTWSAIHLTSLYMSIIALLYWTVPHVFFAPFAAHANPAEIPAIAEIVAVLLKFMAVYTIFDGFLIVASGALKGAGDTRFPVVATVILSWSVLFIPIIFIYRAGYRSVKLTWFFATVYIIALSIVILLRFMHGKWRSMKVIKETSSPHIVSHPSVPFSDVE